MKKLLLLSSICTVVSFSAFSQIVYLADTAFATDVGYGGAEASCVFSGGQYTGEEINRASDQWAADVFTVPAGTFWKFDTVIIYAYQVGSGTTSTFLDVNLEIYNAAPGLGGSVIWGDTVTNILVSTGWTGIYRVDTSSAIGLTNTQRPIMYLKLYLNPAPNLSAGTYWLAWSASGPLTFSSSPFKVLPGRINPSGQQGRAGQPNGPWGYVEDLSTVLVP